MMEHMTPFHWQEAMGHRAEFVEGRLVAGAPILGLSIPKGVILFTYRRYTPKTFEIYDRLALAAIGQQSDIEALKSTAIDFAHREGFTRSEGDVTIRIVVQAVSAPLKRAFADFSLAPFVVRALFAEVCRDEEHDSFALLNYDGDFRTRRHWAYVTGDDSFDEALHESLPALFQRHLEPAQAVTELKTLWDATFITERPEGFQAEAVLLRREDSDAGRFTTLMGNEDANAVV